MNREDMVVKYDPAVRVAMRLLANPLPRERLVQLYNLDLYTFAKVFCGRDEFYVTDPYIQAKFSKFRENPLGSILDLDSTGYERVVEFLTSTE